MTFIPALSLTPHSASDGPPLFLPLSRSWGQDSYPNGSLAVLRLH